MADLTQYGSSGDWLKEPGQYRMTIQSAEWDRNDDNESQIIAMFANETHKYKHRWTLNDKFGWLLVRDMKSLGLSEKQLKAFEPEMIIGKSVVLTLELTQNGKTRVGSVVAVDKMDVGF